MSDITIYDRVTNPMEAVEMMGRMFSKSGMFGCSKEEQGQVLALACLTERKSPFEIMKTYHIIGGKLEMKASAMLAKFIERGGKVKWNSKLTDRTQAAATFRTRDGDVYDEAYTIQDAEEDGLANGKNVQWKNSRADMLRARLISKVIRMIDPAINSGVYDAMEMNSDEMMAATPRTLLGSSTAKFNFNEPKAAEVAPDPLQRAAIDLICEPNADKVNAFLRMRGMITETQTYADASDEVKQKIVEAGEDFISQVLEETK
jgi:hypothetical protein